jgi:hypothetical protein
MKISKVIQYNIDREKLFKSLVKKKVSTTEFAINGFWEIKEKIQNESN